MYKYFEEKNKSDLKKLKLKYEADLDLVCQKLKSMEKQEKEKTTSFQNRNTE